MKEHIRTVLAVRGFSPADYTLLCYGGAVPMHLAGYTEGLPFKGVATLPWAPLLDVFGMWMHMLGNAYYIRGFREETFNYRSSAGWQMAGYDQLGNKRPLLAAGTRNFGPGACGVCDGVDCGGWLATPEVDLGSAEVWELFVPHMEIARRLDPFSVGYGRFRSGLAIPSMTMIHNTKQCVASAALGTASDGILPNLGRGMNPLSPRHFLLTA